MTIFTGIVLFFLIWWTALFAVLPWGVRGQMESGTGAPEKPHLLRKFLITTALAAVLWCIVFAMIEMDVIDFRETARRMAEEDYG